MLRASPSHLNILCYLADVLSAVSNLSHCLGSQGQSSVICKDLSSWRAARGSSGMAPLVRLRQSPQ